MYRHAIKRLFSHVSKITDVLWRTNEFESGGAPVRRAEKKFLVVPLHFFGS